MAISGSGNRKDKRWSARPLPLSASAAMPWQGRTGRTQEVVAADSLAEVCAGAGDGLGGSGRRCLFSNGWPPAAAAPAGCPARRQQAGRRSGDRRLDGQRGRGAGKPGRSTRQGEAGGRFGRRVQHGRFQHGRVADVAGRAVALAVFVSGAVSGRRFAARLRSFQFAAVVGVVTLASCLRHRGQWLQGGREVRGMALVRRLHHGGGRGDGRRSSVPHASGHGGTGQTAQDQHHHQREKKAATHALDDKAARRRFPAPAPRGAPARCKYGYAFGTGWRTM